jgi:hypothetical protein
MLGRDLVSLLNPCMGLHDCIVLHCFYYGLDEKDQKLVEWKMR